MATTKTGNAVGRPKTPLPKNAAKIIETVAASGASLRGVCKSLHVSYTTLNRWMDENPELKEAFERGREMERQTLHSSIYDTATKGEGRDKLLAAMFLLKSRHGYREGEQEQQGNRVQINFQLPGAKPMETYVIENGGGSADTGAKQLPRAITRHS